LQLDVAEIKEILLRSQPLISKCQQKIQKPGNIHDTVKKKKGRKIPPHPTAIFKF